MSDLMGSPTTCFGQDWLDIVWVQWYTQRLHDCGVATYLYWHYTITRQYTQLQLEDYELIPSW